MAFPPILDNKPPPSPSTEPERPLTAVERRQREKKRRRRELGIATVAFFAVLILTTLQLDQFKTGDRLFVVMFNINFVLLLGIFLVVIRNGLKLFMERRRRVLGSHLRTRLLLAFVGLSLLPCLLMFLVTTKYVQLSMDFWFKEQIETSMETALDVARSSFEKSGADLLHQSRQISSQLNERKAASHSRVTKVLLEQKQKEYGLAVSGIVKDDGTKIVWNSNDTANLAWSSALQTINWSTINTQGSAYFLMPTFSNNYVFSVFVLNSKNEYLVLAENMGIGFKAKIDRVIKGAGEYKSLRKVKKPLKLMLYSSLGVLTALIILGAVWFAFRLAREISAPVLAVAAGTERIAQGDLSVRLQDPSEDELGVLVRSFNKMAQDLETSRLEITGINYQLELQNLKIARHSKYIETVLNNIAAGVMSFDADGSIITLNKAASAILGTQPQDLLGKTMEEVLPSSYAAMISGIGQRLKQRIETRIQQTVTLTLNGEEQRLLVNIVGFSTEGVYSGAVAVFEDISEMERMQRIAAWQEVARRIAHEIKNPLTPIKLSAQRLARKFGSQVSDPVFTQSTELIVRQVEHLQSMVQEFSAFAKLPEVKPVPGHIEPILENMTELFRNSHSSIQWELSMADNLPELLLDREALNRAFMNLYSNAVEALCQYDNPERPQVVITATYEAAMKYIKIDVADNGPGLTEEERLRIFEPYFSHKKGGTGLGLTIVRSIVTDHRGYLRALPNEKSGLVLSMELPVTNNHT